MPTETEIQRYKIETNAAAFLQLRQEIEKTPVGPDFKQISGKYPEKYSSVTVVENSYSQNNRSLLSITTSAEADVHTLQAMGHYLNQFLGAHGVAPPKGEHLAGGSKTGEDYPTNHIYYELDVKSADFARARQLTHNLLATGDNGLTPEQAAGIRLISKAEYEATLPPAERNKPPIPHNTVERDAWIASISWPPARTTPAAETAPALAQPAAEQGTGEQPGTIRKFLRSFKIGG